MEELERNYGDERKTQIVEKEAEVFEEEALIKQEPMVVTLTKEGYVKRISPQHYREQRRGGKGIVGATTKEEDAVLKVISANTHDWLLCFTNQGKVHWLKVWQLPEASRYSRGTPIANLLRLEKDEKVNALLPIREFNEQYVFLATAKGVVKKTSLKEFANPRKGGIAAISLNEGDALISAEITDGKKEVILSTEQGMAIRFPEAQVRVMGRQAQGVIGIRLRKGDRVVSAGIVDPKKSLLTLTEQGYAKRTGFEEYRTISRGGVGVINLKITPKNGKAVAALVASPQEQLLAISQSGTIIRIGVSEIPEHGRATQGVRVIKLEEGDRLVSATTVLP